MSVVGMKSITYLCSITLKQYIMNYLDYYEIYDELTNKILFIKAYSDEQAIGISETIDFNDYENLSIVDVLYDIANNSML